MSKLLLIQSNRLVAGVQYPGISYIAAFVKKHGHQFSLFDAAEYAATLEEEKSDYKASVDLQHRPLGKGQTAPAKKPLKELLHNLERRVQEFSPDVVGVSAFSDDWPFALFLIRHLKKTFKDLPIFVGGIHATVAPNEVIKHKEISALCIGEGEQPVVDLLDSFDRGKVDTTIDNFWFKTDGRVIRNKCRCAMRIDEDLPFLDWEHYSDIHFMYPFEGRLYRRGSVNLARGCPFSCTYCINSFYKEKMYDFGYKIRIKKWDFAIEEIKFLKDRYNLEFLRFWDESFLNMPRDYLSNFAKAYKSKIKLPFTIESIATSITKEKVRLLADMGCQSVSIGVETSNEELRKNVLKKNVSNDAFDKAFKILHEHRIRKVANFMFFLPHQTIEDMYQDLMNCQRWKIESPSPRIFYPFLGTTLRDYCQENNMLDIDLVQKIENENAIRNLSDLSDSWISFSDTVLLFDQEAKKRGRLLLDNFILLQESPRWLHDWIISVASDKKDKSPKIFDGFKCAVYQKRFGL